MSWIYIHNREFDKAEKLIKRLPSLESNNLRESIMSQLIHFRFGFNKQKEYFSDTLRKLYNATAKEFYFNFEDFSYFADVDEALALRNKIFKVIDAYKSFENIRADVLEGENRLRRYTPKCYAKKGDFKMAGEELVRIAENFCEIAKIGGVYASIDEMKSKAISEIEKTVNFVDEPYIEKVKSDNGYKKALEIINNYN